MMCRASVGSGGPPLGTHVDVDSGFSAECIRTGEALRCDDTEIDPRVEAVICRRLGVRSIVAAPIRYEREVVGLVEVFSPQPFAFDEGDVAVLERLAQTALLMLSQAQLLQTGLVREAGPLLKRQAGRRSQNRARLGQRSAIFAVQQVPHRLPASGVRFTHRLALVGVHAALIRGGSCRGSAASRAAVGETGFIRLQFELLFADAADFDGESHSYSAIRIP